MTDELNIYIGKKIRALRLKSQISQEMLGERLGVSFQQVQKYETAKNRISADALFRISLILNAEINDFFPPNNYEQTAENTNSTSDVEEKPYKNHNKDYLDKENNNLIRLFQSISDDNVKKKLMSLIKSMI